MKTDNKTCKYRKEIKILPSMCDDTSMLGIASVFDIFQDYATLHADIHDIGPEGMHRRKAFWIITKTKIKINRLPIVMNDVNINTWIQAPERASCERDYSITAGDETLVYGRSIWAVMSRERGRPIPMKELYPVVDFDEPRPDKEAFTKIDKNFDGADVLGDYTVKSTDIDIGGHMNNVHYIRAMLNCFSTSEIKEMNITELEVNFISQTYEGDTLTFKMRRTENGLEIGAINADSKTVFAAIIR